MWQGMIMGPKTALSMLGGALLGANENQLAPILFCAKIYCLRNGCHLMKSWPRLWVFCIPGGNADPAGYGMLGPYARAQGWAPGPIGDWETGATGWILWVSLAIMLGDSITSLSVLVVTSVSCGK